MIRIVCERKDGLVNYLSIKGHANSAPKGEDIVCSAVSAVSIGGLNALENPKAFMIEMSEKDGSITVRANKGVTKHDYQVLDTILIQLKSIEESAKEYVSLVEKGC
jgi:hypothetical protein